jgi:diacylglycerol kinase family enzyme
VPDIVVVLNGRAGRGSSTVGDDLTARFTARGLSAAIISPTPDADFRPFIRRALEGARIAVAAGGDGTVSAVGAAVAGSDTMLGVIPLGTLNHFAKDMKIPMDVDKAIDVIAAGHAARVDVGVVNDVAFLNNSSIGIYPSLVDAREEMRARGRSKWPAFVLAALKVLRTQRRVLVNLDTRAESRRWLTSFLFVGNNAYGVHGLQLAGRERVDAGQLFAYAAPQVRVRDLPRVLLTEWLRLAFRRGTEPGSFRTVSGSRFDIVVRGPSRQAVAIDGEIVTLTQPLQYRSWPRALGVYVPAQTPDLKVRGSE